ncbi:MAG TPA: hypothetical protein ENH85_01610 [Candidatus Scalindua sp.]|nr:hypothetical protein [Candidatus Scalindua sp.]
MTAEIAIMNKEAIALATDSAVTMSQEGGQKISNSANKLFALSKYYPVGIMVYGSASLMGVPWESIIKIYRNKSGEQKFDTLKEYADKFIAFLNNGNPLFPETEQEKYLSGSTFSYFGLIREEIEEKVESIMDEEGQITNGQVKQIVSDLIKDHFNKLKKEKILPSIPKNHIRNIINKYGKIIDKIREEVFEKLPLPPNIVNKLRNIGASLFFVDVFQVNISGVVIAGFGEKDTFPSLKSFDIEGIVNNKLKYKNKLSGEINFKNTATIIPFAQREMVTTFMEGIDPYLRDHIEGYLSEIFDKYPKIIVENIERFDDSEKQQLEEKLRKKSNEIFKDYQKHVADCRRKNYVDPVIKVVGMLPKDELAAMAESLVSLTSFKRKVTMETETVGGPIDVAVISKGDGFIWVKRKYYFKAELNPQFFSNYYRR